MGPTGQTGPGGSGHSHSHGPGATGHSHGLGVAGHSHSHGPANATAGSSKSQGIGTMAPPSSSGLSKVATAPPNGRVSNTGKVCIKSDKSLDSCQILTHHIFCTVTISASANNFLLIKLQHMYSMLSCLMNVDYNYGQK